MWLLLVAAGSGYLARRWQNTNDTFSQDESALSSETPTTCSSTIHQLSNSSGEVKDAKAELSTIQSSVTGPGNPEEGAQKKRPIPSSELWHAGKTKGHTGLESKLTSKQTSFKGLKNINKTTEKFPCQLGKRKSAFCTQTSIVQEKIQLPPFFAEGTKEIAHAAANSCSHERETSEIAEYYSFASASCKQKTEGAAKNQFVTRDVNDCPDTMETALSGFQFEHAILSFVWPPPAFETLEFSCTDHVERSATKKKVRKKYNNRTSKKPIRSKITSIAGSSLDICLQAQLPEDSDQEECQGVPNCLSIKAGSNSLLKEVIGDTPSTCVGDDGHGCISIKEDVHPNVDGIYGLPPIYNLRWKSLPNKVQFDKSDVCNGGRLFVFGAAVGLIYMVTANHFELAKLSSSLKETKNLVLNLKTQLTSRNNGDLEDKCQIMKVCTFCDATSENQSYAESEDYESIRSTVTVDTTLHNNSMEELEAALEAELELMQLNLEVPSKLIIEDDNLDPDVPIVFGELSISDMPASDTEGASTSPPAKEQENWVLSPRELEQRLRMLQLERQEERIMELEADLEAATNHLELKRHELQLWKDRVRILSDLTFSSDSAKEMVDDGLGNQLVKIKHGQIVTEVADKPELRTRNEIGDGNGDFRSMEINPAVISSSNMSSSFAKRESLVDFRDDLGSFEDSDECQDPGSFACEEKVLTSFNGVPLDMRDKCGMVKQFVDAGDNKPNLNCYNGHAEISGMVQTSQPKIIIPETSSKLQNERRKDNGSSVYDMDPIYHKHARTSGATNTSWNKYFEGCIPHMGSITPLARSSIDMSWDPPGEVSFGVKLSDQAHETNATGISRGNQMHLDRSLNLSSKTENVIDHDDFRSMKSSHNSVNLGLNQWREENCSLWRLESQSGFHEEAQSLEVAFGDW